MPLAVSIAVAILVAASLVLGSRIWFERVQKRSHVQRIGIDVLGARHWRDALGLLVLALERDGFSSQNDLGSGSGAPSGERILRRGKSTILLIYKHGTAYRIGAPALLDAETRRQGAGIDEVMIATLGSVEDGVIPQAERMKIALLDGGAVWARLSAQLDATTRQQIDDEATALIERPRRLATLASTVLGLALVIWGAGLHERIGQGIDGFSAGQAASGQPTRSRAPESTASERAKASEPQTAAAVDDGDDAEQRRISLARALKAIPEIENALWASSSTLVLTMPPRADIDDVIGKACSLSADFPEVREVRLQIETRGAAEVRWRRCA